MFLAVSLALRPVSRCFPAIRFRFRCAASDPSPLRSMMLSSLYSSAPDLSSSSESKTASESRWSTVKPIERMARRNSFLSIWPERSSSHARKMSTTR
jgi:hypothetical protein